jgi:hypothetical protein
MNNKITIILEEPQRAFVVELCEKLKSVGVPTSLSKVAKQVFECGYDNIDREAILKNPLSIFTCNGGA